MSETSAVEAMFRMVASLFFVFLIGGCGLVEVLLPFPYIYIYMYI